MKRLILLLIVTMFSLPVGLASVASPEISFEERLESMNEKTDVLLLEMQKEYDALVDGKKLFEKMRLEIEELACMRESSDQFEILLELSVEVFNYYIHNYNESLQIRDFSHIEKNVPEEQRLKIIEQIKLEDLSLEYGFSDDASTDVSD